MNDHSASVPSRPAQGIARLRWPLALLLATALSLGMLWSLAAVIPIGLRVVRTPVAAVLRAVQTETHADTPAPASASVQPLADAPPPRPPRPLPRTAPAPLTTPKPEAPATAPPTAPVAAAGISPTPAGNTHDAPAIPSHPSNGGGEVTTPGVAAPTAVAVADLPLRQRCSVQVKPDFPKLALEDGIEQGHVMARLALDAQGHVTGVTILEAQPGGYFEAATRRAALQWRCLPSGQNGDTVRVPFVFAVAR